MSQKNNRVDLVKTGRSYGSVRDPVSTPSAPQRRKLFVNPKTEVGRPSIVSARSGVSVFVLVVGLLLGISLYRSLLSGSYLTFGGLLETFASAPSIDMSMASFEVIPSITNWGSFQFIADFINFFIGMWNVQFYIFKGIGNVVVYLVFFIKFLFLG